MWKLWAFEYFKIGCNGSSHIVGLVTSLSLIKYALSKLKTKQWIICINL